MATISAYSCAPHGPLVTSDVGRYVPAAELIVVTGTLFPLLAYPFLPAPKNPAPGGEPFPQVCAFMQVFFVHLPNFLLFFIGVAGNIEDSVTERGPDFKSSSETPLSYVILPPWVFYLNLVVISAIDFDKMHKAPLRDHTPSDFDRPASIATTLLLFEVLRVLSGTLARATSSWTLGIAIALVVFGFGLCTAGRAVVRPVRDAIRVGLYRFLTRSVEAWTWLPQDGVADDFEPAWSYILSILISLSGFAVCGGFWWAAVGC